MFRKTKPSAWMIVAVFALVLALGGVSAAATGLINGATVKPGTIGHRQLGKQSVGTSNLTRNAIGLNNLTRSLQTVINRKTRVTLPGQSGITGAAGAKGDTGASGATGLSGAKGDAGATGLQGVVGPAGPNGADSTVAGPTGPKGDQGIKGDIGPAGPAAAKPLWGSINADGSISRESGTPGVGGIVKAPYGTFFDGYPDAYLVQFDTTVTSYSFQVTAEGYTAPGTFTVYRPANGVGNLLPSEVVVYAFNTAGLQAPHAFHIMAIAP